MEEIHKKLLQRNRTNLVKDLDPSKLYDGLLEKGVFTQDMIDEIKVGRLCTWYFTMSRFMFVVGWFERSEQHLMWRYVFCQSSGTRRDQARQLVRDLETRGSRAFPLFLECLQETGQHSLAELLLNAAPPAVQIQPSTPTQPVRPVVHPLPICKCVVLCCLFEAGIYCV